MTTTAVHTLPVKGRMIVTMSNDDLASLIGKLARTLGESEGTATLVVTLASDMFDGDVLRIGTTSSALDVRGSITNHDLA